MKRSVIPLLGRWRQKDLWEILASLCSPTGKIWATERPSTYRMIIKVDCCSQNTCVLCTWRHPNHPPTPPLSHLLFHAYTNIPGLKSVPCVSYSCSYVSIIGLCILDTRGIAVTHDQCSQIIGGEVVQGSHTPRVKKVLECLYWDVVAILDSN